jgi:multidrug resistance protein
MATSSETQLATNAGRTSENSLSVYDDMSDSETMNDNDSSTTMSVIESYEDVILTEESPIVYHYLTFETSLPFPSTSISIKNGDPAPPPPDLSEFGSPFDWPASRKNFMIWLSCIATCITAYTAGSYSPAAAQMSAEWHVSELAVIIGVTTFCVGFAIAPMLLAPFSEINGRRPVFVGAGIIFFVCQIGCAVTQSYPGMLIARFFLGCGSSVFSTMVGGVVSDLYHADTRNTPMSLFSGAALIGTGLGPMVSGFIAQNTHWRWVFWVQVITVGLLVIAVTFFFRETRGSILLSRRAQRLNAWMEAREAAGFTGFDMIDVTLSRYSFSSCSYEEKPKVSSQRIRWKVQSDEERTTIIKSVGISVYRPFHLLFTEPVVFFFSLWVSFAWAVLYLTFGSIPLVFRTSYHFTLEQSNSVFAAMIIAATLLTIISIYQESILLNYIAKLRANPNTRKNHFLFKLNFSSPEARLYFACIESIFLPIGLFMFGWTQFSSIPWIIPTISIGLCTAGIYSVYLATFNYLADTYGKYASSALAAQSFSRNMLGGVFPLVTVQLFNHLTFQGAASLLGGLALLLSLVPWVLVFYGERIRMRSMFAGERM